MSETRVLGVSELPPGSKKLVNLGELEILLVHYEGGIAAVQSKCPHAGGPLQDGAVCNRKLVCPWHMGTFALPGGELLEPPPMEPLKTYTVQVKDQDIYLETDEPANASPTVKDTVDEPVFLVVGAGAAGSMAVTTLRQNNFAGRIVLVDPIASEPVDRTQLSKDALAGKIPLDQIALSMPSKVTVERIGASLKIFNAARHQARLSDGSTIQFNRALIATGGMPKRLEVPGADLAYTIRHSEDVRTILAACEGKKNVVMIGGSFIALEAASALIQKGLRVTVAAKEALPFEKQFGKEVAKALKKLHEANGTTFRLMVEIKRITDQGVEIRDQGAEVLLPADIVVQGVGVDPALDFEHDLPIAKDGGIRVDTSLMAADDVWVGGDIANVNGARIEHWRVAQQHGRTAALAMLGQGAHHEGVPFFWTYHFGKRLDYLGAATKWDEVVFDGDLDSMQFLAFYLKRNGKELSVQAVLSCDRESDTAMLAEVMRANPTLDQARAAIAPRNR